MGAILPVVGISACIKRMTMPMDIHAVDDSYVMAVVEGAKALPLIIPALAEGHDMTTLVERLDGLLLTGSPSNVEPGRYDGEPSREGTLHDSRRDATTLPLIRAAIEAGLPLLAICRGFQELNVALGGTLHQHVQELPGRNDHRTDRTQPFEEWWKPCHAAMLTEGGIMARLAGTGQVTVNSLHGQGVDRLASGLTAEAVAEDGTIEAVSVTGARNFAVGVQWHPEHLFRTPGLSRSLIEAFGDAVRDHAARRSAARPRQAA